MAFTLQQSWDAAGLCPDRRYPLAAAPPAGDGLGPRAARLLGGVLAAVVHGLLLWLLASHLLAGEGAVNPVAAATGRLLSFQLGEPAPASPAQASPPVAADRPPSEVDLTRDVDVPAPEWTVSRILVRNPASDSPAAQPAPPRAPDAGQGGAGQGGGGVYDPFAGAAPLRRNATVGGGGNPTTPGEASTYGSLVLDEVVVASVRAEVEREYPAARGSVQLRVQLSPQGDVIRALVLGGTAPVKAREAMRLRLLGRRVFLGAPPALQVDLEMNIVRS